MSGTILKVLLVNVLQGTSVSSSLDLSESPLSGCEPERDALLGEDDESTAEASLGPISFRDSSDDIDSVSLGGCSDGCCVSSPLASGCTHSDADSVPRWCLAAACTNECSELYQRYWVSQGERRQLRKLCFHILVALKRGHYRLDVTNNTDSDRKKKVGTMYQCTVFYGITPGFWGRIHPPLP